MFVVDDKIEAYCAELTEHEGELLAELEAETRRTMEFPQMLTGRIEGQLLRSLIKISGARDVLEIGMFTGYSALSMASALPDGGKIVTCEIDPKAIEMASRFIARSGHRTKIDIRAGAALETLAELEPAFDLAFVDADKQNYPRYYEECMRLVRRGGIILFDNALWSGRVLSPEDDDTLAIDRLNRRIAADERVENVLLTVRDGINLVLVR